MNSRQKAAITLAVSLTVGAVAHQVARKSGASLGLTATSMVALAALASLLVSGGKA